MRVRVRAVRLVAAGDARPGDLVLPGAAQRRREKRRLDRLGLRLRLDRRRHPLAVRFAAHLRRPAGAAGRRRRAAAGLGHGFLRGAGDGRRDLAAQALGAAAAGRQSAAAAGHVGTVRMDTRLAVHRLPVAVGRLRAQPQPAGRLRRHHRRVRPRMAGGGVRRRPAAAVPRHPLARRGAGGRHHGRRRWTGLAALDLRRGQADHGASAAGERAAGRKIQRRPCAHHPQAVPGRHHRRAGRPDRHAGDGGGDAAAAAAARLPAGPRPVPQQDRQQPDTGHSAGRQPDRLFQQRDRHDPDLGRRLLPLRQASPGALR